MKIAVIFMLDTWEGLGYNMGIGGVKDDGKLGRKDKTPTRNQHGVIQFNPNAIT